MDIINKILFLNQDLDYRDFISRSIPNVDTNKIIGVRMPVLRKISKEIINEIYIDDFLNELPHTYNEEYLLHGIILSNKYKDIDILLDKLDVFLPYVDNWMVCDTLRCVLFKDYLDKVYLKIKEWLNSDYEYVVRFAIVSLIFFYIDDGFRIEELELLSKINSKCYYINMAIAWFYSMTLVKQYDVSVKFFEKRKLNKWVFNKSIQKAIESYQLSDIKKDYLRSLKIKYW